MSTQFTQQTRALFPPLADNALNVSKLLLTLVHFHMVLKLSLRGEELSTGSAANKMATAHQLLTTLSSGGRSRRSERSAGSRQSARTAGGSSWFDKSILGVGQGYYVLYIFHWKHSPNCRQVYPEFEFRRPSRQ